VNQIELEVAAEGKLPRSRAEGDGRGDERIIPPSARSAMSRRAGSTTAEVPGSHAVYVSRPDVVADLIAKAARAVQEAPAAV
jgi:hypothetical protein